MDKDIQKYLIDNDFFSYGLLDVINNSYTSRSLLWNEFEKYHENKVYEGNTSYETLFFMYENTFDDNEIPKGDSIFKNSIFSENPSVIKEWGLFDLERHDPNKEWVNRIMETGLNTCSLKELWSITYALKRYHSKKIMRKWRRKFKKKNNCKDQEVIDMTLYITKHDL